MKSPLTDTYHRYGWLQAYGDLGLKSPFFIVRIIGDVAKLRQYKKPPFLALSHPTRFTDCAIDLLQLLCESVHLIRKNGSRIQEHLPTPAPRPLGGLPGGRLKRC